TGLQTELPEQGVRLGRVVNEHTNGVSEALGFAREAVVVGGGRCLEETDLLSEMLLQLNTGARNLTHQNRGLLEVPNITRRRAAGQGPPCTNRMSRLTDRRTYSTPRDTSSPTRCSRRKTQGTRISTWVNGM